MGKLVVLCSLPTRIWDSAHRWWTTVVGNNLGM